MKEKSTVFNAENYGKLTAKQLILALHGETGGRGSVTVPADKRCDFLFGVTENDPRALTATLCWTDGDCEALAEEFERLCDGLKDDGADFVEGVEAGFLEEGEDEEAAAKAHRDKWDAEAKRRVGESEYAYAALMRAKRLNTLYALGAPEQVVEGEKKLLAQALVLHRFAE